MKEIIIYHGSENIIEKPEYGKGKPYNDYGRDGALKRLRQERKLTQEQLAALSGVNVRSIRSYEQGRNELSKAQGETLMMLAKALNCTVEDLLTKAYKLTVNLSILLLYFPLFHYLKFMKKLFLDIVIPLKVE